MDKTMTVLPPGSSRITDVFWLPKMETVRTQMIPYQWQALNDLVPGAEPSRCIRNFRLAAKVLEHGKESLAPGETHSGFVFQDSDLYKWLEAVAYTLTWHSDAALEKQADEAVSLIASAQMDDGYIDTFYILTDIEKRFTNLKDNHELYCLGHLVESAVAYAAATGKNAYLDIAGRAVDCAARAIGPGEGQAHGYPGHPILEMALVRLFHATGKKQYLDFAAYLINERGKSPLFFDEETKLHGNGPSWRNTYLEHKYYQADVPLREQKTAEGHAVRALYLYSGMADVARETGDAGLLESCRTLYKDVTTRQMYVTGNVGQCAYGESFSVDYDLPNDLVYGETCAQIALVFLSRRMLQSGLDAAAADTMERALYNGVLSGASLDGTAFFYVNPLEVVPELTRFAHPYTHVKSVRQKWFGCACCPPNFARLVSSLGSYVHTVGAADGKPLLATHLFVAGSYDVSLGGSTVSVELAGGWPWEGNVQATFRMKEPLSFSYALRRPRSAAACTLLLNGTPLRAEERDGYFFIERTFSDGDCIQLCMELPVRVLQAHPLVREDAGKLCVARGPIVYCLEEADNGSALHCLSMSRNAPFTVTWRKDLLGGVTVLSCPGKRVRQDGWGSGALYRDVSATVAAAEEEDVTLTWIPYYAWDNRAPGEMRVWVRES